MIFVIIVLPHNCLRVFVASEPSNADQSSEYEYD